MKKKIGFTLIEIIICIAVLMMIAYPLSRFVYDNMFIANNEMRNAQLSLEVKDVLETIISQMRQAEPENIKLFDGIDEITSDDTRIANRIEIKYENTVTGTMINVGYKVENNSFIRYNPDVSGEELQLIQAKSEIKSVNAFSIDFKKHDLESKTRAYTKYNLILQVSDGRGSGIANKKHEVKVETNLIKYKTPSL